jgi:hypothetical protein
MGIFLGDRPVSVFFNGASASLPVQGVFLGPIQVFPTGTAAATLYFDGDVDDDWTTVGNWWLDDEHTEPAGRLPTSADSVVASATINSPEQGSLTVANFTMESGDLNIELTVTGMATFNGSSRLDLGVLFGNATFNGTSQNLNQVIGNATFNDSSNNGGTIDGDATFNDSSSNRDAVVGTATFNDSACNDGGTASTFVPATPPEC